MDFLAPFMLNALIYIYSLLNSSFGLAIVVFTVLLFVATLPLTLYQQRSMKKSQKQMQKAQSDKRYKSIMQKYKTDRRKQQEELMKFYQEKGINPFSSLSGCLPTLIQLPIWFGMFSAIRLALGDTPIQLLNLAKTLSDSIPSSLIPLNPRFLWLENLALPERLPLPFELPFLAGGLPLLTIVVAFTTWLQTKIQPTPATPDGGQAAQMTQTMGLMMPIMIALFVYSSPAGLAIYFVVSNVLRLLQSVVSGEVDWSKLLPKRSEKKVTA